MYHIKNRAYVLGLVTVFLQSFSPICLWRSPTTVTRSQHCSHNITKRKISVPNYHIYSVYYGQPMVCMCIICGCIFARQCTDICRDISYCNYVNIMIAYRPLRPVAYSNMFTFCDNENLLTGKNLNKYGYDVIIRQDIGVQKHLSFSSYGFVKGNLGVL